MRPGDFTLERIRRLMAALGQPQQGYASVHVAGTNGKGSVSALCAAALQAGGHRVGLFTSPHLHGPLEGISVNGQMVTGEDLDAPFQKMLPHLESAQGWTQFEVTAALAFQYFADAGVDVAVIEVGLGGRLDATNMLVPTVSVITPIDYDHTSILGDRLGRIAGEKAGIIKQGVTVVMAPQVAEARQVIAEEAKAKKATLIEVGVDILFERGEANLSGQDVRVWPALRPEQALELRIALLGAHQAENTAVACAALWAGRDGGQEVSDEAIRKGFAAVRWPGRFEVLQADPALIVDAAHSPHAARALRSSLEDYFPGKAVVLVLGVSADKDLAGIIEPLRPRIARAIATQSIHPRAMPAAVLQARLAGLGLQAEGQPDAAQALQIALEAACQDEVVLVCGSVFLVEQIRELYSMARGGLQTAPTAR